jgi:eukaryotic-like serine/threonine-protein kinase
MGSDPAQDPYWWGAESPQHKVTLDAFWIYQDEVTNAMYQACVAAKACPLPQLKKSRTRSSYYDDPQFAGYPVIYVTYVSASAYCQWAGGRLPYEAEWEKAARGDQDLRLFPWGNSPAGPQQANTSASGSGDTMPAGSFPEGASPYGVLDMAGNVWEWVFDYFQPGYSAKDVTNPIGPASSRTRVMRGGGFANPAAGVRIVQRDGVNPNQGLDTLGFRCVVEEK